jgi:hypothetical protein
METKEEKEYRMIIKSYYDSLSRKVTDEDFNRLYSDYISKEKQEKRIKVIDEILKPLD